MKRFLGGSLLLVRKHLGGKYKRDKGADFSGEFRPR